LTPVIFDPKKAILAMKWAGKEIGRRFETLERSNCKDIDTYHETVFGPAIEKYEVARKSREDSDEELPSLPESMPHIVIVVDEYSDITQVYPKEIEAAALKIVQLGHSIGVHMILSSSRVGTKIYTKAILDAVSTRIALQTASASDSKLIIGTGDAHILRDSGDMLYREGMKYIIRGQINMFTYEEAQSTTKSVCERYKDEIADSINFAPLTTSATAAFDAMRDDSSMEEDDMYEPAREAVISARAASTSFIQRKLGIGYSRAAQLMDRLEERGVIGPANGGKPREILVEGTN
jgi:S-DNA-T family DNA segregation ATPase FtsK/SpoIIIE